MSRDDITPDDLHDLLLMTTGEDPGLAAVQAWSREQRLEVEDYACRESARAMAGERGVRGPNRRPRPDCLAGALAAQPEGK